METGISRPKSHDFYFHFNSSFGSNHIWNPNGNFQLYKITNFGSSHVVISETHLHKDNRKHIQVTTKGNNVEFQFQFQNSITSYVMNLFWVRGCRPWPEVTNSGISECATFSDWSQTASIRKRTLVNSIIESTGIAFHQFNEYHNTHIRKTSPQSRAHLLNW